MAAEGMQVEPDDLIVTTGGQQVIDLVCRALIDPGDVVVAEAPTYPGAVPCFSSYQADVVQIEMDDDGMRDRRARGDARPAATREGRTPEVHLHDPELPEPGRRDDVAGAPARAGARSPRERELLVLEDNPYGLLRYEGEPLPTLYSLDGGAATSIYLGHVLEDPLRRACGSAGRRPRARCSSKLNLGKQARRPVLLAAARSTSSPPTSPHARLARRYLAHAARRSTAAGAT